ncbi:DUF5366 family protein [Thalassorhabdus alkalitolerans]|uniref:DUF5366 family protein n=1 Tax=Thalassorhabdus alkalitolerans TaxID=2282697 RepID=A0ABW0YMQ0_9BACI
MKNTYITSHFPLFSILLFSCSLAIYTEGLITGWLNEIGLYRGMMEFFSEAGIKGTLLFLFLLFYFMVFSALKLISDTLIQLSLLFFSNDQEGEDLYKIRKGSWIFLIASGLSLFFIAIPEAIIMLFISASVIYFTFFVYKISGSLSFSRMTGVIFFHLMFWSSFSLVVIYTCTVLYNSFIASLPI